MRKMTSKQLPQEINEKQLETSLSMIGDCDDDMAGYQLAGLKNLAKDGKKLPLINPFVKQDYVVRAGNAMIYPVFNPSSEFEAEIKRHKRVYEGNCSLVLCTKNNRDFVFFDPESKYKDYDAMVSKPRNIRLAAISLYGAYVSEEQDFRDGRKKFDAIAKQGFIPGWKFPLYESLFEILEKEQEKDGFAVLKVRNPLDKKSSLQLVLNTAQLESREKLKQVVTDFYFIGSVQ